MEPVYLVCKVCKTKEWLNEQTAIVGCPKCGSPRFAEDDAGNPYIVWSEDPDGWTPNPPSLATEEPRSPASEVLED